MALGAKARRIVDISKTAFSAKGDLNTFWQDVAEMHMPEQADFTDIRDPDQFGSELYDNTPALMRRDFGDWLGTALRPKGREWSRGRLRDLKLNDNQSVKAFMQEQDRAHRSLLYDDLSNFTHQMKKADHDYVTFGNSVTFMDKRADGSGFSFKTAHLRDCAWMENQDGHVDTIFRKMKMPVKQILSNRRKRGWNVPDKLTDLMQKEPNKKFEILHVNMPSDHYHAGDKPKHKDREFCLLYVCPELECVLHEEETYMFQHQVSRWFRLSGSPYAISPCTVVSQPDARTMQSMAWSIMQAGELAVEPAMVGQSEAVLSAVNLFPSGITWLDRNYDERMGLGLRPIEMGKMPDIGMMLHQSLGEKMGEAWYLNKLFLPQLNHEMTAREVERRWEEFLRVTQPIIEPAEGERNGSMLRITHDMAWRSGWMNLEMPEELENKAMDWTYDNPIEDARQKGLLLTFQQSMELTMGASQLDPSIPASFNVKKAHRDTMQATAKADWMLEEDSDELKQKEEALSQKAEQSAMMDQVAEGAEIAAEAKKADLI